MAEPRSFKPPEPKSEMEMAWMTPTTEQPPIIAVDRLPLSYEQLKAYLDTGAILHIEAGPGGRELRKPIVVRLPPRLTPRDLDIYSYIIETLAAKYPKLIPYAVESPALKRLAAYLRWFKTSSPSTFPQYVYRIERFCRWAGCTPDILISRCLTEDGLTDRKRVREIKGLLEEYVGELRSRGMAPGSIRGFINPLKTLLRVNGVEPPLILLPQMRIVYEDRAPRPEELWRMIQVADLRGKVVVSMLALGGFRIGTLAQLRYYHVKEDLERGTTPLHIHVESEITKGKYCDFDIFIGAEAVEYLRLYLDQRMRGSPSGKIPPEEIDDDSPLIRDVRSKKPKPASKQVIYNLVRSLYFKAGLAKERRGRRYVLRPHSIRKFFRTQLAALGVPADYIEYMMGHKVSTYHDIKMKGVEFLRNIYATAGLSIRPRTTISRIEMLKEIIRAWGLDPEKILVKEALMEPNRTLVAAIEREEAQVKTLANALREMLRRELLG
jgi:hypothetical protein